MWSNDSYSSKEVRLIRDILYIFFVVSCFQYASFILSSRNVAKRIGYYTYRLCLAQVSLHCPVENMLGRSFEFVINLII